ncbi:hypothetical protein G3M48_009177 [Beauveria asiatica]|uniref:Uncharacterized protein n=1 Tax=Beauveria asiatica TaxID=1069075 RepID=A0AAW0S2S1_9HYPO
MASVERRSDTDADLGSQLLAVRDGESCFRTTADGNDDSSTLPPAETNSQTARAIGNRETPHHVPPSLEGRTEKKNLDGRDSLSIFRPRHIKENWNWYLFGAIVFVCIALPITLTIGIDSVVQLIVNQQTLPVDKATVRITGPQTVQISMQSAFKIPSRFSASLSRFTLQLYERSSPSFSPFVSLDVPDVDLTGGWNNFSVPEQQQKITDEDALVTWFDKLFGSSDDVSLSARGVNVEISVGALHSKPRLDKSITFRGLDNLGILAIERLWLLMPSEDGYTARADVQVHNPSPLTLDFGDVYFSISSGNVTLGRLRARAVHLPPKDSISTVDLAFDPKALVGNIGQILMDQAGFLGQGIVRLKFWPTDVLIDGQHILFAERILKPRFLSAQISVTSLASNLLTSFITKGQPGGSMDGTAFVNAISTVFKNQTLLDKIANNWKRDGERSKHKSRP